MSTHSILFSDIEMKIILYHNDPKFLDKQVLANSADPDQRSSLIRVFTVCYSICIFLTKYPMV